MMKLIHTNMHTYIPNLAKILSKMYVNTNTFIRNTFLNTKNFFFLTCFPEHIYGMYEALWSGHSVAVKYS